MSLVLDDLIAILGQQAIVARLDMANAPNDGRARWAAISHSTIAPLTDALRAVPAIAALEGQWCQLPNEGHLINLGGVAVHLLDRAQYVNEVNIAEDLQRLAVDKTITLVEVRLVAGVSPTKPIDLGDGFSFVPPEHAPITEYSHYLFSRQNQPRHGWGDPPTAAIIRRSTCSLELRPVPKSVLPLASAPVTTDRDWQAALLACALASDAAPQFRQSYSVVDNPGWIGPQSNGLRSSESFPVPCTSATWFDEIVVSALFQKLRPENKTIDLAVERLVGSRRRLSPEERALDLGTSIEILLMSGSRDNSEISYKIATRAAWLVGENPEDRLRYFRVARQLYADRSVAAHTGSLASPRSMDEMSALQERFRASDRLCVSIIEKLLDRGVPRAEEWMSIILNLPE